MVMVFDCVDNLYNGFKYYEKLYKLGNVGKVFAKIFGKTSNAFWLYNKLRSGYKVIDIGIDIGRVARSPSYFIERIVSMIWKIRNAWKWVYHLF